MVENAETARDVEGRVAERQRRRVALDEADVPGRELATGVEIVGSRVDRDDLADVRSERQRERAGAGPRVERDLVPGERPEQAAHALAELGRALPPAARVAVARSWRSACRESTGEGKSLLARGDRSGCALLVDDREDTSDLGPGREIELVAAHERLAMDPRAVLFRPLPRTPWRRETRAHPAPTARSPVESDGSPAPSRPPAAARGAARPRICAARERSGSCRSRCPNTATSRNSGSSCASSGPSSEPPSGSSRPTSSSRR